ncbi:MAG: sulfatase [bacterium]|nr:sulfatase [bacterium]
MKRREFLTSIGAATLLIPCRGLMAQEKPKQPGILLLLSDDQNWDGLSVLMDPQVKNSKSSVVQTPNIAALATQGMRFTNAYSPASVCSPTRISIQTGKSPAQVHWTKAGPSVNAQSNHKMLVPRCPRDIPKAEVTIAELLKTAGYRTAHYGKWHIGGRGPESHGYDKSDGNTGNEHAGRYLPPNPVDIFGMGKRAIAFMKASADKGKPFFVQMSYNALHYGRLAMPETLAKYRKLIPRGNDREISQAAIAEDLDTGVGLLLKQMKAAGLDENTYVIYMSDNGGGGAGRNRPLRGGKGTLLEGGIRVPFIIRGPGIKSGSTCSTPIVGYDLLPTFCKLAGVNRDLPKGIEGGDFRHLLRGSDKPVTRLHEGLYFHFPHYQGETPQSTIRLGDYKLIHHWQDDRDALYNLASDSGERKDLAASKPDITSLLRKRLDAYLKSVGAKLPTKNPNYDPNKPTIEQRKGPPREGDSKRRRRRE